LASPSVSRLKDCLCIFLSPPPLLPSVLFYPLPPVADVQLPPSQSTLSPSEFVRFPLQAPTCSFSLPVGRPILRTFFEHLCVPFYFFFFCLSPLFFLEEFFWCVREFLPLVFCCFMLRLNRSKFLPDMGRPCVVLTAFRIIPPVVRASLMVPEEHCDDVLPFFARRIGRSSSIFSDHRSSGPIKELD